VAKRTVKDGLLQAKRWHIGNSLEMSALRIADEL
jgi:hypothetical protein